MLINILTFLVILFLIFINGLTDATNAISTLVGTKVMSFRKACMLSAFFDIIGIFIMYVINNSVVDIISKIAILPEGDLGLTALCIGMFSAIFFSFIAMLFGFPTSESHGLISGITGAAIAIGGVKSINILSWGNVLLGLLWSIIGSILISKIINIYFKRMVDSISIKSIKKMQVLLCAGMSFAHGAQDGLKFIGILHIYTNIVTGSKILQNEIIIMLICALTMGLGVLIGGKRIVTTVGEKIVKLENADALCTDISGVITLIMASLFGMPVSTTHVKTMAIVGVSDKKHDKNKFKQIALTWGMTFPICGLLAFVIMNFIR